MNVFDTLMERGYGTNNHEEEIRELLEKDQLHFI